MKLQVVGNAYGLAVGQGEVRQTVELPTAALVLMGPGMQVADLLAIEVELVPAFALEAFRAYQFDRFRNGQPKRVHANHD